MKFRGHAGAKQTHEDGTISYIDFAYTVDSEKIDMLIEQGKSGDIKAENQAVQYIDECNELERYLPYIEDRAKAGNERAQRIIDTRNHWSHDKRNQKIFKYICIVILISIVCSIIVAIKHFFF